MTNAMRLPPLDALMVATMVAFAVFTFLLTASCGRRERPESIRIEPERREEQRSRRPPKYPQRPKLVDYIA